VSGRSPLLVLPDRPAVFSRRGDPPPPLSLIAKNPLTTIGKPVIFDLAGRKMKSSPTMRESNSIASLSREIISPGFLREVRFQSSFAAFREGGFLSPNNPLDILKRGR